MSTNQGRRQFREALKVVIKQEKFEKIQRTHVVGSSATINSINTSMSATKEKRNHPQTTRIAPPALPGEKQPRSFSGIPFQNKLETWLTPQSLSSKHTRTQAVFCEYAGLRLFRLKLGRGGNKPRTHSDLPHTYLSRWSLRIFRVMYCLMNLFIRIYIIKVNKMELIF